MESSEIKRNIGAGESWLRLLFMVVMAVLYTVALNVIVAVAVFQWLHLLFTGRSNRNVTGFSDGLASWTQQTMRYLLVNSEVKPYPFSPWPVAEQAKPAKAAAAKPATRRRATASKSAAKEKGEKTAAPRAARTTPKAKQEDAAATPAQGESKAEE